MAPTNEGESTEAPLVTNTGEAGGRPPSMCQICCRHTIMFFAAALIGFLLGLGFSHGMVAIIVTLVVLVLILGVFFYYQGWKQCYQTCVGCMDINRDGQLNCRDCVLYFTQATPEQLALLICGFILGIVVGAIAV